MLKLRKNEFFELTPRQFAELLRAQRLRDRHLYMLVAQMRADLINFSFCHPKKLVKLDDLLPPIDGDPQAQRLQPQRRRLTAKRRAEIVEGCRAWMRARAAAAKAGMHSEV